MTRPSACRRGYDRRWQRISAEAIGRQPWCSECGATEDLTGDHIIPVSLGGLNTAANCQVLCRRHNSAKGQWQPSPHQLTLEAALASPSQEPSRRASEPVALVTGILAGRPAAAAGRHPSQSPRSST